MLGLGMWGFKHGFQPFTHSFALNLIQADPFRVAQLIHTGI